jgi:uncharacterized protein (DUF58 family)
MHVTRRYWTAVTLATLLAVAAVLLVQPLLVVGAAGIGAWLLVHQALFVRTVTRTNNGLSVTQSVTREQVIVDDEVTVTFDTELSRAVAGRVEVAATLPLGAESPSESGRQVDIEADGKDGGTTFTVGWPMAGRFEFGQPTVTVTDELGLFESTFPAEASKPLVTVIPRRPRDVHVGEGGEKVATAFGDHKTGDFGLGLDPGEIREYVPGDTLRQIDWKATARSTVPHVREFEEETDRRMAVLFDHRASMATGVTGETELEYARQVALAFVEYARSEREPLGLYTIGNEGITVRYRPTAEAESYSKIQTALYDLTPMDSSRSSSEQRREEAAEPRDIRRNADRLQDDDSPFGTNLRTFFATAETYVQHIADDPLYNTVRTQLAEIEGTVTAVVVTDDRNRAEVREAVTLAGRHCGEVVVLLAPRVLFEQGGLTDMEAAYDQYTDFEEFRRDLAQMDGVAAFEIAPGDRLDALLTANTPGRATTTGDK